MAMTLGWRTELDGGLQAFGPSAREWAQGLLEQSQGIENKAKELRNQVQTLRNCLSLKLDNLKISQKQKDDLRQQMDQFRVMLRAQELFAYWRYQSSG